MTAPVQTEYQPESLRVPPHSNEAEQSILGALLREPEHYPEVQGLIKEDDFHRQDHSLIFRGIVAMIDQDEPVDVVTVSEYLKDIEELERAGGLAYLGTMAKDVPSAANIRGYAKRVAKHSRQRRLIAVGSELADKAFDPSSDATDLIQKVGNELDSVLDFQEGETFDMKSIIKTTMDHIEENVETRKTKSVTGIPIGIPEIDDRLGGLRKKKVYLIGARPGGGKTALSNQGAIHAGMNGYKVGIISLEMDNEELGYRMMAHFYQVSGTGLMFGSEEEVNKLKGKIANYKSSGKPVLADAQMQLDTDTYSLSGIVARLTQWKRKYGLDVVIVDHIGLVENKGNNRNESVGEVSRTFKKLSKRLDVAMIVLVQLNRENVKNNRRPQESDLRDSGSLEQDADVIIFLHVEDESKGHDIRPLWIGLSKVRFGIPGWIPSKNQHEPAGAPFGFEGKTQTIRGLYNATSY